MKKIILGLGLILVFLSGCTTLSEDDAEKRGSTQNEDLQTQGSSQSVEGLQLDSVVQLTNYQEVIHRPPEHATISGDGNKIAFFRFVTYYDTELGKDEIHNAVYVANTNGLNEPKMVFESMTIPSIVKGDTQYYYFANVRGSTALTDDGKHAYFITTNSIRGSHGYDSALHLGRVNTETKEFTPILFPAVQGYVETRISNFILGNDKIYYYGNLVAEGQDVRDGTDYGIFKMNFDGSSQELLVKLERGSYPNLYVSDGRIHYDGKVDRIYFMGEKALRTAAFYYVEGNALKEVPMTEEQASNGILGVSNGKMFPSTIKASIYDVASGQMTDLGFNLLFSRKAVSENGVLIYGRTKLLSTDISGTGPTEIIGDEVNEEYKDHQFRLIANSINPFNGKGLSDNGKTILVQEDVTGFGNYYAIKLK